MSFGSYPKQISRYALVIHMGILDYNCHITIFSWLVFSPFADSQWPFIHPSPLSVLFFKPMYHSNSLRFRISLLIKFHSSSVSMEIRSPLHPSQRPLLNPHFNPEPINVWQESLQQSLKQWNNSSEIILWRFIEGKQIFSQKRVPSPLLMRVKLK